MTKVQLLLKSIASSKTEEQVKAIKDNVEIADKNYTLTSLEQMYLLGACHCKELMLAADMLTLIPLENTDVTIANVAKVADTMTIK